MVPWFIIKQTQTETAKLVMCILLNNGSMVHNQTITVMTISHADPLTVLLENGSMVHNQMNADRLRKLSVTFLENVRMASTNDA